MMDTITMIGEQITNLCKTLSIMDDIVQMNGKLKVVDPEHVMAMEVESLDGSAAFEIVSDKMLDPEDLVKMKIGAKDEFEVRTEDNLYVLRNAGSFFGVHMIEPTIEKPVRIPSLDLHNVEVSGKMLKDIIGQVSSISDNVTFSIEDGDVWITGESENVKVGRKLAITDRDVNVLSKFPTDYLKKIMKVAGSTVTLGLGTDYPMTFEWCDNYYRYKVLLAPRVEAK